MKFILFQQIKKEKKNVFKQRRFSNNYIPLSYPIKLVIFNWRSTYIIILSTLVVTSQMWLGVFVQMPSLQDIWSPRFGLKFIVDLRLIYQLYIKNKNYISVLLWWIVSLSWSAARSIGLHWLIFFRSSGQGNRACENTTSNNYKIGRCIPD
jgi:hypothetical protein